MSTKIHSPSKRRLAKAALGAAAGALVVPSLVSAQTTSIKFQLDWRFEGPASLFLVPAALGYFKAAGLEVQIDPGTGSGAAVQRVASGAYDLGFADMAALMEFHANNPDAPIKPVAVMMVYNNTPATVFSLKKSGFKNPSDLAGKKLGAPVFDAGRRGFPIFQKANGLGNVTWVTMEPALRETMLAKGEVDAITGFSFTSYLNLLSRGVAPEEIQSMMFLNHGVRLYGNAIIASPKILKENPAAVRAFLAAFTKGARQVITQPAEAINILKQREGIINVELENRRLELAIDQVINSPDARTEGFGRINPGRMSLMASQVSDAFNTKTRIDPRAVWDDAFLPSAAELNILPTPKPVTRAKKS